MFEDRIAQMNQHLEACEMPEPEKRVYTCEEIQDILGVSRTTIYQLIKSKVFHTVRVGGQYRISKKSFDKWLDNHKEPVEKRIYTADEVASLLDVCRNSAYALVKSKVFKSVKIGGQYRVSKISFDEWLEGVKK